MAYFHADQLNFLVDDANTVIRKFDQKKEEKQVNRASYIIYLTHVFLEKIVLLVIHKENIVAIAFFSRKRSMTLDVRVNKIRWIWQRRITMNHYEEREGKEDTYAGWHMVYGVNLDEGS